MDRKATSAAISHQPVTEALDNINEYPSKRLKLTNPHLTPLGVPDPSNRETREDIHGKAVQASTGASGIPATSKGPLSACARCKKKIFGVKLQYGADLW